MKKRNLKGLSLKKTRVSQLDNSKEIKGGAYSDVSCISECLCSFDGYCSGDRNTSYGANCDHCCTGICNQA